MKRVATLFIFSLLLFLNVRVAAAKPSASPFRVTREDRIATAQANVLEKRRTNVARFLKNMVARLRAYVARLEKLITRIESRIDKIAEESPDTDLTTIKTDVNKAKTLLGATGDKIDELEAMGDALIDSDTPKEDFKKIKGKLADIKADLKEVHLTLVHAIGDIKGLRVGEGKNESE